MADLAVVSMMRETPDVIERFIEYYRRLGASDILIYFDGPEAERPDVAGARFIMLTPQRLAALGSVGDALSDRQQCCFRDAYDHRVSADWMLVVDADEFVFGDCSLQELLDAVPEQVEAVVFPTAEAVWGPGDDPLEAFGCTVFRTPWKGRGPRARLARAVYGSLAPLLQNGVMGHSNGKHMVRTGRGIPFVGVHRSKRDGKDLTVPVARLGARFAGFRLGHFDAISKARWEVKWRHRIDGVITNPLGTETRRKQMKLVAAALAAGDGTAMFRRFYGLNRVQYSVLRALGLCFRRTGLFEPAPDQGLADQSRPMRSTSSENNAASSTAVM